MGHNFVFRLAKDERIVVDSIALHPTRVIDCPGLKKQVNAASVSEGVAIITPVMQRLNNDMTFSHMMIKNLNATSTMNATEWASAQEEVLPSATSRRWDRASSRTASGMAYSA